MGGFQWERWALGVREYFGYHLYRYSGSASGGLLQSKIKSADSTD